MKNKLVTVIVPVYNGGLYIARCIDSILTQQNFDAEFVELLLMNDGSRDNSLKILEEYQAKYPSIITVIDQENIGVAQTRNKGIQLARGDYTVFVDQDDWIEPDYLATFYNTIEKSQLDVVGGGYRRPDSGGAVKYVIQPPNNIFGRYMVNAAWSKIHRTRFLVENNITFFDNKYGEDTIFSRKEVVSTSKWVNIEYVGYNWFFNEASVSSTTQKGLKDTDLFIRLLSERFNIKDPDIKFCHYDLLKMSVFHLLYSGKDTQYAQFMPIYKEIFSWLESNVPSIYKENYLPLGPKGEKIQATIGLNAFVLLHKLRLVGVFARLYCRKR